MQTTLRLSLLQMTATTRQEENAETLRAAAARAAGEGAELLALPEAAGMMNRDWPDASARLTTEAADTFLAAAREAASRHGLWIQAGSTPIAGPDGRALNHATLIDPAGAIHARYDKIHLFDVFLEGRAPTGESERYAPGAEAVLAHTPWGPWGMSVCYDLRFPHLYRDYALAGATVLFVPSAFTVPTGRAHWETLLRARAIETGAFVVAAAQVGRHADGRSTWGHSLVVDPWGAVRADLGGEAPGQRTLDLDLDRVGAVRAQIPALALARDYRLREMGAPASE